MAELSTTTISLSLNGSSWTTAIVPESLLANITNITANHNQQPTLDWSQRVITALLFTAFAFFGLFTNIFPILLTFFSSKLRQNRVNFMVANMSSADFLECLIAVCGQNLYILYGEDGLGPIGCKMLAFIQFVMTVQTFLFPPCLSINRYMSLFRGHSYDRIFTTRNTFLIIIGSWLLSTIIPMIFLLGGQNRFDQDNLHCCIVTKDDPLWTGIYWVVIIVPLMGCCNGTMMYCNLKIFQHLKDHAVLEKIDSNIVKQNREMLYLLMIDMLAPIGTHTVYHVVKFAYPNRHWLFFRRFFTCLLLLNSSLRGVCTLTLLGPYRREAKRFLSGGRWKSNTTHPGPAATSMAVTNKNTGAAANRKGDFD